MKYEIKPSSRFKKDMKLVKKRGYDPRLIETVIKTNSSYQSLAEEKGIEYVVSYYGFISNDSPFDPFGGCMGVKTTSGDEFNIPAYFNEEIEIIEA